MRKSLGFLLTLALTGGLFTAEAAPSTQASPGIDFDLDVVRKIAAVNPGAASVLLMFHPAYREPLANLLKGAAAFPGMPTAQAVELAIDRADDQAQQAALTPVDPGMYVQVKWEAMDIGNDLLQVTFVTELIDDTAVAKRAVSPKTLVLVSKTQPHVVSVSYP